MGDALRDRAWHDTLRVVGVAIPRHRCLMLLRNQNRPISWITAPAGSGKSHVVQQMVDRHSGPTVVVRLDEGDADPGRFFRRLAGAVRKAHPGFAPPAFGGDDLNYL